LLDVFWFFYEWKMATLLQKKDTILSLSEEITGSGGEKPVKSN